MEDEGKGLSESERRTRGFRTSFRPTTFFLEHGRVFAVGVGLVGSAIFEALWARAADQPGSYVRGDCCGDRTGQDLEGGKISFKRVSDDCAR